jgi:predicted RNA-binding Zn ribbon-like protein
MEDEHGVVPDDLVGLVAFLNTIDLEEGTDDLGTARGLAGWASATLGRAGGKASSADADIARRVRAGLRGLSAGNSGEEPDASVLADAATAVASLPLEVRLSRDGSAIGSSATGPRGALGEMVASYIRAVEQGRWARVKLCASPTCRWAFWDNSRNMSRRWCMMARCGSRAKMRTYRLAHE